MLHSAQKYPGERPKRARRGSAIIEFALVGTFIFIPLLAGLTTVGLSVVTGIQVQSLNSSAGQLFAAGTDFSATGNGATILSRIAGNLNSTQYEVILSEIDVATDGSGNLSCGNQVVIGQASLGASQYVSAQLTVSAAFNALLQNLTLGPGQKYYLAETYYNNPALAWVFAPVNSSPGMYFKAVF